MNQQTISLTLEEALQQVKNLEVYHMDSSLLRKKIQEATGEQALVANGGPTFEQKLKELINFYSKENESDTPDFILASFLTGCLDAFSRTTRDRDKWYGHARGIPRAIGSGLTLVPPPNKWDE